MRTSTLVLTVQCHLIAAIALFHSLIFPPPSLPPPFFLSSLILPPHSTSTHPCRSTVLQKLQEGTLIWWQKCQIKLLSVFIGQPYKLWPICMHRTGRYVSRMCCQLTEDKVSYYPRSNLAREIVILKIDWAYVSLSLIIFTWLEDVLKFKNVNCK